MEAVKIESVRAGKRLPHGINALLRAWHCAVASLLDSRAVLLETEEMYAVFEEESASYALAMLSVAFSRYAQAIVLDAEEQSNRILLRLTGAPRKAGVRVTQENMLPARQACRPVFEDFLARSGMAYSLTQTDDALCLSVALPRFLADRYDVCAKDTSDLCDVFYDAMLFLSGEAPKRALPI